MLAAGFACWVTEVSTPPTFTVAGAGAAAPPAGVAGVPGAGAAPPAGVAPGAPGSTLGALSISPVSVTVVAVTSDPPPPTVTSGLLFVPGVPAATGGTLRGTIGCNPSMDGVPDLAAGFMSGWPLNGPQSLPITPRLVRFSCSYFQCA